MGKGASQAAQTAANSQANVAQQSLDVGKQLLGESAPMRKAASQYYSGILAGGPQLTQSVSPSINAATQQFFMARRQAQNQPPGGARDAALRDINLQQASTKAGIYSGGVNEAAARLASMGWGGTQQGVGAYGQSGQGFGGASQNLLGVSQQQGAGKNALGGGLGMAAGMFV